MAAEEVVSDFRADLIRLTEDLDANLPGLILCMAFQKRPALVPGSWILVVCADALDAMSQFDAIAFVLDRIEAVCSKENALRIERVSVLQADDPQTAELLEDVCSRRDRRFLVGRTVYGRRIGKVELLLLRKPERLNVRRHEAHA